MTLILYATKYGAAREAAQRLSDQLGGAAIHDLKAGSVPGLEDFDTVILGSAIYAGSIRKEARTFLAAQKFELAQKRLGFYLCGISKDERTYLKDNFPKELLEKAVATGLFGGKFDPEKANGLERLIMKAVAKQAGFIDTLDDEKIKQFANLFVEGGR